MGRFQAAPRLAGCGRTRRTSTSSRIWSVLPFLNSSSESALAGDTVRPGPASLLLPAPVRNPVPARPLHKLNVAYGAGPVNREHSPAQEPAFLDQHAEVLAECSLRWPDRGADRWIKSPFSKKGYPSEGSPSRLISSMSTVLALSMDFPRQRAVYGSWLGQRIRKRLKIM
jgi:hypothetical protein